jgi:hypothetical protein
MTGKLGSARIKGVSMAVILLSVSSSIALVAMTPGMEQPVPTIIGIMDLPDSPIF